MQDLYYSVTAHQPDSLQSVERKAGKVHIFRRLHQWMREIETKIQ